MKKIKLLSLALLSFAIHSKAQNRHGLWISPNLQIAGGTMTDIYPSEYNADASAIVNLGADGCWMFNNHIGAGTGLAYGAYAYQWSISGVGGKAEYIGTQVTLDIPVFVRFVTGNGGGGFFAQAGFINSFNLVDEETLKLNGNEVQKATGSVAKQDFKNYSILPFVYFGGNIRCGNKVQMTLGPQISYQINGNFSESSGLDGHYLCFGVKLGVGIHCSK
ncbi:hypothetical protein F0919_11000 [Taibaiella lutea]|uniref:Outer membrane protein beta-barrel domain-containing protein n=1 Tax=Taibaiella lutea TaxID=2608001 RepID=A0A5M6CIT5_9BACT|nr:hypothetical protein [Taibaiella lutea]KAA5535111.1 hypothetical protein F0919_11000 [Taibaiella lutea]